MGKSTLLNRLVASKKLVRVSKSPGRTQMIHLFQIGAGLRLADLPGYGFSAAPADVNGSWDALLSAYFLDRAQTSSFVPCVLIDARRGLGDLDEATLSMLAGHGMEPQVVLTKADKLRPRQLHDVADATTQTLTSLGFRLAGAGARHQIVCTSASKVRGGRAVILHRRVRSLQGFFI